MPWKETKDAYAIWLSEVILQQTTVAAVKDYFRVFTERWPTSGCERASEWSRLVELFGEATAHSLPEARQALENGASELVIVPLPESAGARASVRVPASNGAELTCGPFRFIKNSLKFYVDGEEVDLTATEFKLMLYLSEHRNVAQNRHDLLMEVMGYSSDVHSRTLDTHMKRLRRKLGQSASLLETVRGIGYRINVPDEDASSGV